MLLDADVVEIYVSFLLGLEILSESRAFRTLKNGVIKSTAEGWTAFLVHRSGHVYIQREMAIFFTEKELK